MSENKEILISDCRFWSQEGNKYSYYVKNTQAIKDTHIFDDYTEIESGMLDITLNDTHTEVLSVTLTLTELFRDEKGWAHVDTVEFISEERNYPGNVTGFIPLTETQIKEYWDSYAMFIIWADGSDSLLQENDYTMEETIEFIRNKGAIVLFDETPAIIFEKVNDATECEEEKE